LIMSAAHIGHFNWMDLMTRDLAGAARFYGELVGWRFTEIPMGEGSYTMLQIGEGDDAVSIGGVVPLPSDGEHANIPPHWIGYVGVGDIAATAAKIAALGGQVPVPPTPISGVGTFAVAADPTGGHFSPIQFEGDPPAPARDAEGTPLYGAFCWHELMTQDTAAAGAFYQALLGWRSEVSEMPGGPYTLFTDGHQEGRAGQVGGMMKAPMAEIPTHWLGYIYVGEGPSGVDAHHAKAKGLGAAEVVPPMELPNVGRFSVLHDPTGAVVALFGRA